MERYFTQSLGEPGLSRETTLQATEASCGSLERNVCTNPMQAEGGYVAVRN
jgi:hypothetical protein